MDMDSHDMTVLGDTAIHRFNWVQRITLRSEGQTLEDKGKCIWIWRRGEDGAWRVASAIWNSDLAEPGIWAGA